MRLFVLVALLCVCASARALQCANGGTCADTHTCTAYHANAGHAFGCAPHANATVCNDRRFSCSAAHECVRASGGELACVHRETRAVVPPTPNVASMAALQASSTGGACALVQSYLPSFCQCTDGAQYQSTLKCLVSVLSLDNVGVKVDLAPCASPAHLSLEVVDTKFGIDYTIASLQSGTNKEIPIPGLSVGIPDIGDVGVYAAIQLAGAFVQGQVTRFNATRRHSE